MIGFRLCSAFADREHGPLNVVHEAPAGKSDLGALFDLVHDAGLVLQDARQLLGIGREAGALHALMLQVGVEAKALGSQGLARDLGHGPEHGARLLKGKAGVVFRAGERHQWQRGAHLDAECTAVSQEHAREVRTKVSRKGRCVLLSRRAGLQQIAFPRDNTDRKDIVSGGAALAATPKNAVLGEATPNRRVASGQRAPIGRAHTERREVLMQFLPAAPGLDRHITIFQIDLDDGIHAGHIDQHTVGRAGDVTAGIAHTAPAGDDRRAALEAGPHECLHFIDVARAHNRTDRRSYGEDVLRVQRDLLGIRGDDLGRQ